MKKHRILALLLMGLLLLPSVLTSCSESPVQSEEETTATSEVIKSPADVEAAPETAEETEDDGKTKYAPDLPEKTFDGYAFRIVSRDDDMHRYNVHTRDLYAEEMTGDAITDAVFKRNAEICETYDIEIVVETHSETTNESTPNNLVQNSVMADSDDFDLLATHMINGANTALKNVFLSYNHLQNIDLSKPYWNQSAHKAFSVGNKTYLALSDMCFSSNDNTHCMFFNKKLAEDHNLENLYDTVKENKWTYDKFRTLVSNVSMDLDGDGQWTQEDLYGYFIGGGSTLINWMFAADLHVAAKDEQNIPYLDFYSEKTVDAYNWTYELYNSDDSYYIASWVNSEIPKMFAADKALFLTTQIGVAEDLRDMESDFGVLPYPKYDENQETYYHYVDGHATIMAVPKTVRDTECTGTILEALAYLSYKDVLPWYYDVLMTKKNVRDEASGEMIELIYDTRAFDFAYVYDNFTLSFAFQYKCEGNVADLSAYYKGTERATTKTLERIVKNFDKFD